ncbi:MAG: hypothetical protein ACP5GD_02930 [Candidatus Micrarchaeia archaeon]
MQQKLYLSLVLLVSTFLGALGQIFFKIGVEETGIGLALYVIIGLVFYLASTVIYFYVLSRTHLSWAYGFTGLSYIFASIMAFYLLAESIPLLRWIGIAVIAVGTFLVGMS